MKKTISRIGCFLLAILLGLYSVAIPADADALSPGEWFVTGYYRVTSDGVMGHILLWVLLGIVALARRNIRQMQFIMDGWMFLT